MSRWAPLPLLGLSVIPCTFGTLRVVEVFGGPQVMPSNARIASGPVPAVVHIVCGSAFLVLGALQFSAPVRRRWPAWHRRAGRWLVPLGLAAAASALWMTLVYPTQTGTGSVLKVSRVLFAAGLTTCLAVGYRAIKRRDVQRHRAFMMRAYALALGAGTQAFTIGIGQGVFGKTVLTTDLSTASGWILNLAIAEVILRSNGTDPVRRRSLTLRSAGGEAGRRGPAWQSVQRRPMTGPRSAPRS